MREMTDKEIGKSIEKALNRLEIATDIIKSVDEYLDVPDEELTEGERCLKRRSKEFLGRI